MTSQGPRQIQLDEQQLCPPLPATHTVARFGLRLVVEGSEEIPESGSLDLPAQTAVFLWNRVFKGLDREVLCAAYFDAGNRMIGWTLAYVGCLTHCSVEPRGILVPALLANASGVIVAHNHPSGVLEPSQADRLFALKLRKACDFLGLNYLDSMILTEPHPSLWPFWVSF